MGFKITIDGYAATGKGTLARKLAREIGILNIDSGMLYRAIGLYVLRENIDITNIEKIKKALKTVDVKMEASVDTPKVYIKDEDVSHLIRTEQVAEITSKVSKIKQVREYVLKIQRSLESGHNVIMEGRDIGSEVFPDAELKIFLTADVEERAKRRYNELIEKGKTTTLEDVRTQIINRDREDSTRKISPLRKTEDMVEIDTTSLTIDEVLERAKELVKEKGLL